MCFALTMLIQEVAELLTFPLWVGGTPSSPAYRTAVKSSFVASFVHYPSIKLCQYQPVMDVKRL